MRVRRTLVHRVDTRPCFIDFDLPRIVEARTAIARLHVVGDLEPVRSGVLGVQRCTADDLERPAGRDGAE